MAAAEPSPEAAAAVQRARAQGAWRVMVAALALATACQSAPSDAPRPRLAPSATNAAWGATAPRFVAAPSGLSAVEPFIREQVELASATGSRTLVYVGASWCEPCQRFHAAVLAGRLDDVLAKTRLVEFDAEQHNAPLHRAGYVYEFIPVIAIPNPDGRSSGHLLSGSIKGPSAVTADLVPRLRALLAER